MTKDTKNRILINQSNFLVNKLQDLTNVNMMNAEDGSILIYNPETNQFVATNNLDKQDIDGGHY